MTILPTRERTDDRKLIVHRLIARRLRQDPSLLVAARAALHKMGVFRAREAWERLLAGNSEQVAREIVRRGPVFDMLRVESPFYEIPNFLPRDPQVRRRLAARPRRR